MTTDGLIIGHVFEINAAQEVRHELVIKDAGIVAMSPLSAAFSIGPP
jgi:hypothetical protein